jgi:hypothetical protein
MSATIIKITRQDFGLLTWLRRDDPAATLAEIRARLVAQREWERADLRLARQLRAGGATREQTAAALSLTRP